MPDGAVLDISEARRLFNTMDERLSSDRVIYVTRHRKTAFAVVDAEYLSALIETVEIMSDPDSYSQFMASLDDVRAGRLYDHDDVEKELG